MQTSAQPLLAVDSLSLTLGSPASSVLNAVSFCVQQGEIVGMAGESGSGKSVTCMALTRLLPKAINPAYQGSVRFNPVAGNLLQLPEQQLRKIRGRQIAYLFQEPSACFNPVIAVGKQLREIFRLAGHPRDTAMDAAKAALQEVGIEPTATRMAALPVEFSGGMLQRLAIACALAPAPRLLIADEPTTALDASSQLRVIELLRRLHTGQNLTILFVSHDLGLLKSFTQRLIILQGGSIVEQGATHQLLANPAHPYTRRLIAAVPKIPAPQTV